MKDNDVNVVKLAKDMIEISKQELLELGKWKNNSICTSIALDNEVGAFLNDNKEVIQNLSNAILDNEDVEEIAIKGYYCGILEFNIKFY